MPFTCFFGCHDYQNLRVLKICSNLGCPLVGKKFIEIDKVFSLTACIVGKKFNIQWDKIICVNLLTYPSKKTKWISKNAVGKARGQKC